MSRFLDNFFNKYYIVTTVARAINHLHALTSRGYSCVYVSGYNNDSYFLHANSSVQVILTTSNKLGLLFSVEGRAMIKDDENIIDSLGVSHKLLGKLGDTILPEHNTARHYGNVVRNMTINFLLSIYSTVILGGSESESLKFLKNPKIIVTTGYTNRTVSGVISQAKQIDFVSHLKYINSVHVCFDLIGDSVVLEILGDKILTTTTFLKTFIKGCAQNRSYVVLESKDKTCHLEMLQSLIVTEVWRIKSRTCYLYIIDFRYSNLPLAFTNYGSASEDIMMSLMQPINYMLPVDMPSLLMNRSLTDKVFMSFYSPSNTTNNSLQDDGSRSPVSSIIERLTNTWGQIMINFPSYNSSVSSIVSEEDNPSRVTFKFDTDKRVIFNDYRLTPHVDYGNCIMMQTIRYLKLISHKYGISEEVMADGPYHKVWSIVSNVKDLVEESKLQTCYMSQTNYVRSVGVYLRSTSLPSYVNDVDRYISSNVLYNLRGEVVKAYGTPIFDGGDINGHVERWPTRLLVYRNRSGKMNIPVFVSGHMMYIFIGAMLGNPICINSLYNQIDYHYSLLFTRGRNKNLFSKKLEEVKDTLIEYDSNKVTFFHSPLELYLGIETGLRFSDMYLNDYCKYPKYVMNNMITVLFNQHVGKINMLIKKYPNSYGVSDSVKDINK